MTPSLKEARSTAELQQNSMLQLQRSWSTTVPKMGRASPEQGRNDVKLEQKQDTLDLPEAGVWKTLCKSLGAPTLNKIRTMKKP